MKNALAANFLPYSTHASILFILEKRLKYVSNDKHAYAHGDEIYAKLQL